jgi:hypothetical protein
MKRTSVLLGLDKNCNQDAVLGRVVTFLVEAKDVRVKFYGRVVYLSFFSDGDPGNLAPNLVKVNGVASAEVVS